jgi:hypothetical protein
MCSNASVDVMRCDMRINFSVLIRLWTGVFSLADEHDVLLHGAQRVRKSQSYKTFSMTMQDEYLLYHAC